jgi:phage/plasmid-associated DNA primase
VEWHRDGLRPPTEVLLATLNYRQVSDPLADFMTDCCVFGDVMVPKGQLYEAYKAWAGRQGFGEKERLGATSFSRRMVEKGYIISVRKANVRWHVGIAIRVENEENLTLLEDPESEGLEKKPDLETFAGPPRGGEKFAKGEKKSNPTMTLSDPAECPCETCPHDPNDDTLWRPADEPGEYHCVICHPE